MYSVPPAPSVRKAHSQRREEVKAHSTKGFPALPMALNFVLETSGVREELEGERTVDWYF